MLEHVIVGMGMSSLGVIEGLVEAKKDSILVVDIPEKEIEYSIINGLKKAFGQIGLGGNSQLWHGVISYMTSCSSEKYNKTFDFFLNKYYSNSVNKMRSGYSFIPYKPLRPKRMIETNFKGKVNFLFDKLLLIHIAGLVLDLH